MSKEEMDKYYTPSLNEFHVGFEYETYNSYRKEWYKTILTEDNLEALGSFWYNFLEAEHRVKYLDKEDIESLGWIPNSWAEEPNELIFRTTSTNAASVDYSIDNGASTYQTDVIAAGL